MGGSVWWRNAYWNMEKKQDSYLTDRFISWKEQIQFILKDPAATSRRQLSYNTTIKVKMTMNQYPLYLRIEMKRNLFWK
jgi:hypothetical protein